MRLKSGIFGALMFGLTATACQAQMGGIVMMMTCARSEPQFGIETMPYPDKNKLKHPWAQAQRKIELDKLSGPQPTCRGESRVGVEFTPYPNKPVAKMAAVQSPGGMQAPVGKVAEPKQ